MVDLWDLEGSVMKAEESMRFETDGRLVFCTRQTNSRRAFGVRQKLPPIMAMHVTELYGRNFLLDKRLNAWPSRDYTEISKATFAIIPLRSWTRCVRMRSLDAINARDRHWKFAAWHVDVIIIVCHGRSLGMEDD